MKSGKIIAFLLCFTLVTLLFSVFLSFSKIKDDELADSILEAAAICHEIYTLHNSESINSELINVSLSSEIIMKMMDTLGNAGYCVIDDKGKFNMQNPQQLLQYCQKISDGDYTTQGIYYTLYTDGHIGVSQLCEKQLRSLSVNFIKEPEIYLDIITPLLEINYTSKGWLIYQRDFSSQNISKPFNHNEYTMVRVTPLPDSFRDFCEKYVTPIGYFENNMFSTNWNEDNWGNLDLSSLYASMYGMLNNGDFLNWYNAKQYYSQVKDSDLVMIPQDHFESVIQSFLNIPISEIRSIPEYDFSEQAYYFLGWQTGYYSVVPRLPIPEVTDVRNNEDGTFTLIVDAVFPWYGTDCAFQHETTIRCKEDGTFHFIENHVIEHEKNIFPSNQLPALRKGAIYFAEHK